MEATIEAGAIPRSKKWNVRDACVHLGIWHGTFQRRLDGFNSVHPTEKICPFPMPGMKTPLYLKADIERLAKWWGKNQNSGK